MKKLLLFVFVAVFSATVSAQSKMFTWGVEGGMNFNSLSFSSDLFESGNRLGFFVGPKLKVKVPLVGLGVDGAVLYSLNTTAVSNRTESLSFLEIPLNLRYSFSLVEVLSIYLATGPQFNYCMSSDDTMRGLYGSNYSAVSRSTWGWNVGGGIELFKHLQIGVTYTIPISNSSSLEFKDVNFKQKTAKVRLAYFF